MGLKFDPRYIISLPYGILRLVIIIVAILVMICMGTLDVTNGVNGLIWFTISGSAITAAVFLIFYIINFPPTFPRIPWSMAEFGVMAFWVVLYIMSFIACCVQSSKFANILGGTHAGYGAAAFFCLVNLLVCGYLIFLLFRLFRSGVSIQSSTTTTVTTETGAKY